MIKVTIFSGHSGRLRADQSFYLTLFGGFELVRPTIARQLLAQRQADRDHRSSGRRPFFLTIFGSGSIKSPTLTEEFIDLHEMLRSNLMTMEDWERAIADLDRFDIGVASFTIFGGFEESKLPSEAEEIDSLAVQRHLGNISESAGQVLQCCIGQHGAERRATVRRAILASA